MSKFNRKGFLLLAALLAAVLFTAAASGEDVLTLPADVTVIEPQAFYGLAGEGDFPVEKVSAGDIFYFVYADEEHCAIWKANEGWTGDAYWQQ